MKKVFSNSSQVIHLFAQRIQSEGRSSNCFFEGDKLYSYGKHYLLAEFITNQSGELAVMINDKGYSATTSKHISEARQALSQYKRFYTMSSDSLYVFQQLENLADKLQKAKKPELYILPAEQLYNSWNEFKAWRGCEDNNLNAIAGIKTIIEVFRGQNYSEYLDKKQAEIKQAEKLRILKAKKEFKDELKKFFSHEVNRCYRHVGEDFLRISKDGKNVETSQGVIVSVNEASLLYKMIQAKRDIKGYNIQGYTVISINGVLKIGCHNINTKNMHEIGQKIIS
jgi:hypothetical protein